MNELYLASSVIFKYKIQRTKSNATKYKEIENAKNAKRNKTK